MRFLHGFYSSLLSNLTCLYKEFKATAVLLHLHQDQEKLPQLLSLGHFQNVGGGCAAKGWQFQRFQTNLDDFRVSMLTLC